MNLPFPSANTEHPTSEKSLNAKAFQSWRWVFLTVILLAAVTIGAFYFSVVQAQETNGAITGLTLTSDTPGTLTVSWDTASPAPTDYRVDWAKSTEGYKSWKVDEGHVYPAETAKTVTITDLAHDTEYKIRMRARYYKGEHEGKSWGGPWAEESLQVAANTQQEPATPTPEPTPTPAPGALDEVNSTDDGSGGLVLSWQAPAAPHDQPADYRVNWAKSADEYPSYTQEDANAYPTNSTHTLEGLEYDTEYKIQIRARYYQGEHEDSPWSGPWRETTAQVQQPLPAAPNLTGTPLTPEGQVMLVWQDPSDDSITGYQILRGPDADSLAVIRHRVERDHLHRHVAGGGSDPHLRGEGKERRPQPAIRHGHGDRASGGSHTGTPLTGHAGLAGPFGRFNHRLPDPARARRRLAGRHRGRRVERDHLHRHVAGGGSDAVKARNAAGLSPLSNTVTATMPPAAPTGLTALPTHDSLMLSWHTPDHDGITGYQILRGPDADSLAVIEEDTGSSATIYTDTSPAAGQTHTYAVKARNAAGLSPLSDTVTVTVPPAAPNLTGTPLTPEGQVMLVWQDPSDDSITGYQILRGPDADSLAVIEEDTGSSATIYTDTSPAAGQTHTYAVKARNAAGLSPLSNTVTATMPPAAPTGLTALPTHDSLMLSWHTPDHDGITGYQILRGPDADSLEVVATDTGSLAPWYVDTDVSEDTSYAYAVKALGAGGESAPSGVVEVSTLQAATITFVGPSVEEDPPIAQQQQEGDPPPSPYHLRLFASHDRVTLRWGSYGCCGNVTGFRILRGPSEDTLEVLVADTGSATPWYVDSAVEAGTGYVYAIKSLNGNGESPESTSRSVTTSSAPGANTLLSNMGAGVTGAPVGDAAFVGSGKAAQAFTTGDNAQGYNLEGVRVDVFRGNDAPIDPKVSLYATNGFRPSTLVYELTPPERDHTLPDTDTRHVRSHEYRRGSEYYTAPAGATLSANTRYLVVFEQGSATDQAYSSSYYTMGNITGEANSGAASGWSIGYSIHIDSGTQIFRTKRQIAIIGSAR